ncbi:hypothetical protein J6590_031683 [Homalodisca vitripennis]|uniref:Uncharacterized protein n=1 Tax=Homalodisca liturata TaxID=320908 RepID=A0A1B6H5L1_9HEMI|nr:hypothetical protein J6590_031683 [Homalodisca vitripennis]
MMRIMFVILLSHVNCVSHFHDFDILPYLDENITDILENPCTDYSQQEGYMLIKCLKKYRNKMKKLLTHIEENDTSIVDIVHHLHRIQGPSFLRAHSVKENILTILNWTESQFAYMERLVNENSNLWRALNKKYILNHHWFDEFSTTESTDRTRLYVSDES